MLGMVGLKYMSQWLIQNWDIGRTQCTPPRDGQIPARAGAKNSAEKLMEESCLMWSALVDRKSTIGVTCKSQISGSTARTCVWPTCSARSSVRCPRVGCSRRYSVVLFRCLWMKLQSPGQALAGNPFWPDTQCPQPGSIPRTYPAGSCLWGWGEPPHSVIPGLICREAMCWSSWVHRLWPRLPWFGSYLCCDQLCDLGQISSLRLGLLICKMGMITKYPSQRAVGRSQRINTQEMVTAYWHTTARAFSISIALNIILPRYGSNPIPRWGPVHPHTLSLLVLIQTSKFKPCFRLWGMCK